MNGRFKNRETLLLFDAFMSYAKRKAKKNETKSQKGKRRHSGDVNCGSSIAQCILTPKSKRKQLAKNRLTYARKVFLPLVVQLMSTGLKLINMKDLRVVGKDR